MKPNYIKIYKYVVNLYKNTKHFHYATFDETYFSLKVFEMCKEIVEKLPKKQKKEINMETLLTAALLHDVGKIKIDHKLFKDGFDKKTDGVIWKEHPKLSVPISKKYLKKEGFSKDFIDEVCYLIKNHSNQGLEGATLSLKVLQDADLIADTGFAGFIRPFMYAGKFKRSTMGTLNYCKDLNDRTEEQGLNLKVSKKIATKTIALEKKLFNLMRKEVPEEFLELFPVKKNNY